MKQIIYMMILINLVFLSGCDKLECTEEAKVCPDGSTVGRNQLRACEFDPCPEGFEDFDDPKTTLSSSEMEEIGEGTYYNLFHSLYFFSYHEDNSECIQNTETDQCMFVYAILNLDEKLCDEFPEEMVVETYSPPSSGGSPGYYHDVTYYYKGPCKSYVSMFDEYVSSDQIYFCEAFEEEYIKSICLRFTCHSYNPDLERCDDYTEEDFYRR